MTLLHDNHARCDGCSGDTPATTPLTSERFENWERIPMHGGGEAHLCERCRVKQDRGWLAHDFVVECDCCERNSVDHPEVKHWRRAPAPPESSRESLTLCIDCYNRSGQSV